MQVLVVWVCFRNQFKELPMAFQGLQLIQIHITITEIYKNCQWKSSAMFKVIFFDIEINKSFETVESS